MIFQQLDLVGAWLIEPEPHRDHRGFFARTFCVEEFGGHGLETSFAQHAVSRTVTRGTVRGMHFQREPHAEVKVVACARGAIFDVIVDLRENSTTYRQWCGVELTDGNLRRLYIPKGFAHGFQTLTDDVDVAYLISAFHAPGSADGVRHDDLAFGIRWPLPVAVMSDKDRGWPAYDDGRAL